MNNLGSITDDFSLEIAIESNIYHYHKIKTMEDPAMKIKVLAVTVTSHNYPIDYAEQHSKEYIMNGYEQVPGYDINQIQLSIDKVNFISSTDMFSLNPRLRCLDAYLTENEYDVVHFYFEDLLLMSENRMDWLSILMLIDYLQDDKQISAKVFDGKKRVYILPDITCGLAGKDSCSRILKEPLRTVFDYMD